MKFDLSYLPTTFDAVHVGLAALSLLLLLLLVILLTIVVISMLRRSTAPPPLEEQATLPVAVPHIQEDKPEIYSKQLKETVKTIEAPPVVLKEATPDAALQLLGLFQQEARFIDFIQEDVTAYSDAQVGAAVRVVHDGCKKVLSTHFNITPVRQEQESSRITLAKGFDPTSVRLTGNIVGEAPFTGTLIHRGWQVSKVKLPKLAQGHNVNIVAAAEVEL